MPINNKFLQISLFLKYGFFNQAASINFILLFFMNLFYSIAPIFLGLALSSSDNHNLILYVALYLIFNYFPYLTEAVRSVCITKWKVHAQEEISSVILNNLSRNYLLLNDRNKNQQTIAVLTGNSQKIILSFIEYMLALAHSFSSCLFTLIFVTIYSTNYIVYSYGFSLVVIILITILTIGKQKQLAEKSEIAFNESLTVLGASWSKVILSQPPFIDKFNRILGRKWHNYSQRSVNATLYFQIIQNIQALIIWLPCVIVIYWYLSSHELKESVILLAYLPRIIELLLDMSHIAMNLTRSGNVIGQLNWLDRFILQLNSPINADNRIQFSEIHIYQNDIFIGNLSQLGLQYFYESQKFSGRISIKGKNGSGKSTLLLLLKLYFSEKSILVTSQASQRISRTNHSDGEARLLELRDVFAWVTSHKTPILLLDEWNAHLDDNHESEIRAKLSEIAQSCLVIEVLHH